MCRGGGTSAESGHAVGGRRRRWQDEDSHHLFPARRPAAGSGLAERRVRLPAGDGPDQHGAGAAVPQSRVCLLAGHRAGAGPEDPRRGQVRQYRRLSRLSDERWNRVVQTIATSGKPVLYADFQYGGSGGFLVYMADFIRKKAPNVGFVASSRFEDLVEAVKCFERVQQGRLDGGLCRGHRAGADEEHAEDRRSRLHARSGEDPLDAGVPRPDEAVEDPRGTRPEFRSGRPAPGHSRWSGSRSRRSTRHGRRRTRTSPARWRTGGARTRPR